MKISLKKILKKISMRKPLSSSVSLTHPYRDWRRVLALFVFVVAVLFLWSAFLFWKINTGELFTDRTPPSAAASSIDREGLKNVLEFFDTREQIYKGLLETAPVIEDPR